MKYPFDKIYCIHSVEDKEKFKSSKLEFEKVGILDQVEYWWTVNRPFSKKCGLSYNSIIKDSRYSSIIEKDQSIAGKLFDKAMEHHTIIKQAYYRRFKSILIFEDDIKFNVNEEELNRVIAHIPEDFDVIAFQNDVRYLFREKSKENLDSYNKTQNDYLISGTTMYALSEKAMEVIINFIENENSLMIDKFYEYIDRTKLNVYEPMCKLTIFY